MEVNFVFQVRSFHRLKREISISANAQALWLELFGLFNERHFPEAMPVSTTHLASMLGISKDSVIRARKELFDAKLLEEVGERKGRQHTIYRIIYFTLESSRPSAPAEVEKPVDNVDNQGSADVCDAYKDANCNANVITHHTTKTTSQDAAQTAAQINFCDAPHDANRGTYTNVKQATFKLKRNPKRSLRSPKKFIRLSSSAAKEEGAGAREASTSFSRPHENGQNDEGGAQAPLCYNDAWRTDERARRRTAQNVIETCRRPLEEGVNELLCRYMGYGMTPEQELAAIERGDGGEKTVALLNEAAHSLGIYHAAYEAGKLGVDPEAMYASGGDVQLASFNEKRQKEQAFILRTKVKFYNQISRLSYEDREQFTKTAKRIFWEPAFADEARKMSAIQRWLEGRKENDDADEINEEAAIEREEPQSRHRNPPDL